MVVKAPPNNYKLSLSVLSVYLSIHPSTNPDTHIVIIPGGGGCIYLCRTTPLTFIDLEK